MKNRLFTIIILFLTQSCFSPMEIETDIIYPMDVGNGWTYLKTVEYSSDMGSPVPDIFIPPFDSLRVYVSVDRTEILDNGLNTYVVKTRDGNSSFFSENYYMVKEDGLYHVAYKNAGTSIAFPKSKQNTRIRFNNKSYININELYLDIARDFNPLFNIIIDDSLTYENPPLQTLKYPLQIGSQWTYRENYPWPMAKSVEDRKIITTLAGSFSCFEIKWLYDMDRNKVWDENLFIIDYIAEEGLVKRTIIIQDIFYTDESGNIIETFDLTETLILTGHQVQPLSQGI